MNSIYVRKAGALLLVLLFSGCHSREQTHPLGEFIPEVDQFWQVVPRQSVIERIGINFEFTEGPAWHPKGYLVFSDIPGNVVYRWTGKKFVSFRSPSHHSNGLLFKQGGDLLSCEHGSRSLTRLSPEGKLTTLVDSYQGRRLNSPNDLCRTSFGVIYFTDPPWGLPGLNNDPDKELPFNGVYRWDGSTCTLIDSMLSWPNGIALSPDERFLYVANMEEVGGSEQYDVFWVRYMLGEGGEVQERKIFYRASDTTLPGGPDGMKVDRNGNLFATGPGGVLVIDSTGTHLGTITLPIPPSNLAFGPKEKDLYLTARTTVYRMKLD